MFEVLMMAGLCFAAGGAIGFSIGFRRGFVAARKVIEMDVPREGTIKYPYTKD